MDIALVVVILLLIYGFLFVKLPIVHPLVLFLSINLAVIVFYMVSDFGHISQTTIIVFLGSILSFITGYIVFLSAMPTLGNNVNSQISVPIFTKNSDIFVFFLSIFVIVGMAKQGLINASNGNTENFFLNLRIEHIKEPSLFWFYPHMVLYIQFYLLVKILTRFKDNARFLSVIFLFISFYGSFWKMERTGIIMSIFSLIIVVLIKKIMFTSQKVNYLRLILIGSGIMIFFMLVTVLRSNTSLLVAFNSLTEYFIKPLYTFDSYVLEHEASGDYRKYFGAIGDVLIKPFWSYERVDIYVEDLFTVYTYLEAPFVFGGRYLNFFTMFIIGGIYSLVYYQVRRRDIYMIVYYSLFVFPLIMSFFSYIFSWNHWIYFLLISVFMRLFFKNKKVLINDCACANYRL